MRLDLKKLLAGDFAREAHAAAVASALGTAREERVVVIDFSGILAVTSAFVRKAIVANVRSHAASNEGPSIALAKLRGEAAEGVLDVVSGERLTLFEALKMTGASTASIAQARLVGADLDPSLRETLDLVVAAQNDVTAPQLQANDPKARNLTPTAWNNRLNDLAARGLVRRVQDGRRWFYSAYVKEIV